MLPKTLALIDDDQDYTEFLAQFLRELGISVHVFKSSNDLLGEINAYSYDFYVVDLTLPGIDGLDLIDLLRRRTAAGIVVVSGRLASEAFKQVINAGADMYLSKPVQFEQIALTIEAVQRRVSQSQQQDASWKLDRRTRQMIAPDGGRADLSDIDMALLSCFVEAGGEPVTRDALLSCLLAASGGTASEDLSATIYRLRRRVERVTPNAMPLHSKSRVGYVFNAPLTEI